MLTADIISVESEEGLIRRHARGAGVQLMHQEIKLEEECQGEAKEREERCGD